MKKMDDRFKMLVVILLIILESVGSSSDHNMWTCICYKLLHMSFVNVKIMMETLPNILFLQLVLLLLWGDYLEINLLKNASMIFSRTKKCKNLLFFYLVKVSILVLISLLAITGGIMLIYGLKGYSLSVDYGQLRGMLLYFCYLLFMVLIVNILSMFCSAIYAVLITLGSEIASFYFLCMIGEENLKNIVLYLIPANVLNLAQHTMPNINFVLVLAALGSELLIGFGIVNLHIKKKEWM